MELSRFDNIVGIKTPGGGIVGFHAHNLQVAKIDESAWLALSNPHQSLSEAQSEIELWNRENDPQAVDGNQPQEVRSLAINVAQVCNLKCTYCAAGGDGTFGDPVKQIDLSVIEEQIRMLMHDVPNGGQFRITFLGGEPLLVPQVIKSIARFAGLQASGRDIQTRFDIVTNGTLVTPAIADMLASIRAFVTVSIDGPPEVNDLMRPGKSGGPSTDKTLRGITYLKAVQPLLGSLSSGSVFGAHNNDILGTYRFLQPFGFDSIKFDFAAAENDDLASDAYAKAICDVADAAWTLGGEAELRRLSIFNQYFRILDSQTRIRNHCGAGKSHLHSDSRGQLTTCQWFSGDASEKIGQGTVIDHAKLLEYSDPLTEKHDCGSCWARNLCGGGCMFVNKLKTGSKHTKDQKFCHRTRSIIAKGIELYAEAREQNVEGDRSETY